MDASCLSRFTGESFKRTCRPKREKHVEIDGLGVGHRRVGLIEMSLERQLQLKHALLTWQCMY